MPHDDKRLLKFNDAGTPLPVIAVVLGRTRSAVESRLATLKKQTTASERRTEPSE